MFSDDHCLSEVVSSQLDDSGCNDYSSASFNEEGQGSTYVPTQVLEPVEPSQLEHADNVAVVVDDDDDDDEDLFFEYSERNKLRIKLGLQSFRARGVRARELS